MRLILLLTVFICFSYWKFQDSFRLFVNEYNRAIYIIFLFIIWLLIILGIWGIYILIKNRKEKKKMMVWLVGDIVTEINEFKPLKRYRDELPYQMELAWYLRKTFPTLVIEEGKWWTRPDIIVENIAIEIKWPTRNGELRTIADKIIRYLKHYDKLIVVLFTLEVPEKQYLEWKEDIQCTFESKKDKLFILDI